MSPLDVRNVPQELYDRLRKIAAAENDSLSAEVVALLERAVKDREMRSRQKNVLSQIRRRRYTAPPGARDSVALLREDRAR